MSKLVFIKNIINKPIKFHTTIFDELDKSIIERVLNGGKIAVVKIPVGNTIYQLLNDDLFQKEFELYKNIMVDVTEELKNIPTIAKKKKAD